MIRLALATLAIAGASFFATANPAVAGPRCGPGAHWVAGHYGPYHHWHPGRCV